MEKVEYNGVDIVKGDEDNCVMLDVVYTMYPGIVKIIHVPYGWKDLTYKQKQEEKLLNNVDKPVGWSSYALCISSKSECG